MKSSNPHSGIYEADTSRTLDLNGGNPACNQGGIVVVEPVAYDGYNQALTGDKTMSITGAASDIHHIPGVVYAVVRGETRVNELEGESTFYEAYQHHGYRKSEKSGTLTAAQNDHVRGDTPLICELVLEQSAINTYQEKTGALCARDYKGVGSQYVDEDKLVVETVALEGNGQRPSHRGDGYAETDKSYTLNATEVHGVAYGIGNGQANQSVSEEVVGALNCMHDQQAVAVPAKPYYIVRRLTPTECARLQGFADRWGDIEPKTEFSDEEYKFWLEVRHTYEVVIKGKDPKDLKDYNHKQMLTWYNKLPNDGAEYKMYGNGVALPCVLYVMQGIVDSILTRGVQDGAEIQ